VCATVCVWIRLTMSSVFCTLNTRSTQHAYTFIHTHSTMKQKRKRRYRGKRHFGYKRRKTNKNQTTNYETIIMENKAFENYYQVLVCVCVCVCVYVCVCLHLYGFCFYALCVTNSVLFTLVWFPIVRFVCVFVYVCVRCVCVSDATNRSPITMAAVLNITEDAITTHLSY